MKWKIGWGLVSECNMNCAFCYSKLHRAKRNTIIPIDKITEFININRNKISAINFGTGENSLSEDWWCFIDILRRISPEILLGVTTNGSLFGSPYYSQRKEHLAKECLNDVDVSLDFADPKLHNLSRGNSNAYNWAIESLIICQEIGLPKSIVLVATKDSFNKDNLEKIISLAFKHDACLRINIYRPITGQKQILPVKQFYQGLLFLVENLSIVSASDPLISAILGEKRYKGDFTGKSSFRILDDGYIAPSTYLISEDWKTINIFENPNIDFDILRKKFSILLPDLIPNDCARCSLVDYCRGGAFDRRWLWHQNFTTKDPYCPFEKDVDIDESLINEIVGKTNYSHNQNNFVHDGYLPTLIFSKE